jgi:hypothetical protein
MTMEDIAKTFKIDINVLYKELGISFDKIPATTQMKKVKEIDTRLGENSVRDAVAKITGFVKGQTTAPAEPEKTKLEEGKPTVPSTQQTTPATKETAPAVKTPAPAAIPSAPATQKTPAYTEEMVKAQFEGKGSARSNSPRWRRKITSTWSI